MPDRRDVIAGPPRLEPPARRGRPAVLSRDMVVGAAVALVRRDGFEALSVRRLAADLSSGATTIYGHVADKDQLVDLVLDALIGQIAVPGSGDPAGRLLAFGRSACQVLAAHPGAAELILQRGGSGPNGARLGEEVLGILGAAGVPAARRMDAYHSLLVYINGFTIATTISRGAAAVRRSAAGRAYLESLPPQEFPYLRAATRQPPLPPGARFDYGLRALLDGLLTPSGGG